MIERLKKLHKLWKLSKKDMSFSDYVEKISEEEIKKLPDQKAEFLSEGTEADFKEYENSKSGVKAWIDRIKSL